MSGACPQIVLSLENQKNPMQWNDNFFRNRTCDEHVKLCWDDNCGGEGLQAILLEQQQCAVSWDQHWIQSESMLLLYLMTSHILWLFTAILEVTFCDFLQLFWKSHFVTFYSYFGSHKLCLFRVWWGVLNMETQNLSGYWGEYRRVDTNCN